MFKGVNKCTVFVHFGGRRVAVGCVYFETERRNKMKRKKERVVFEKLLAAVVMICLLFGAVQAMAGSVDDSNQDFETSNPVGSATPGKASYSPYAQMWKISVYVAKKDTVTNSSEYSLTDDYYKFGETFWLYGDDMGVEQVIDYGIKPEKIYLELHNKEEYVNQGAKFIQAKYPDIKGRVFKGSENGFSGSDKVPLVHNFPYGTDSTAAIKAFFDDNRATSDNFVRLAAKAKGSTPEALLGEMEFTINGERKTGWNLNMVDIRTNVNAGRTEHTSCVSWVFMYEPVIIINGTDITGYFHGVTATGMAAAMKQGVYNWCSSSSQFTSAFKSGASFAGQTPSVSWGLGTTFPLSRMPNSIFLAEDWLGYRSGAYWTSWNGKTNGEWYVESQFQGGGFGLRYQRAVIPKVVISKTINGTADTALSLAGFRMTVTDNSTGEKWETVTDSKGKASLYLPSGKYTLTEKTNVGYEINASQTITIPDSSDVDTVINVTVNNETIKTGSLHISKVASDRVYDGVSFSFTNALYGTFILDFNEASGNFTLRAKDGVRRVNVKYTVTEAVCGDGKPCKRINVYGLPVGSWTVTENCPERYTKTLVGYNHINQAESLKHVTSVVRNASQWVRFDNFAPRYSLSVVKRIKISDVVYAHGTPVFFVKICNGDQWFTTTFCFAEDYVSEYLANHPGAEWVEMEQTVDGFGEGDELVLYEAEVMRYRLGQDGIEVLEGVGSVNDKEAVVVLDAAHPEAKVRFTNEKYYQGGTSHNSVVVNGFVTEG